MLASTEAGSSTTVGIIDHSMVLDLSPVSQTSEHSAGPEEMLAIILLSCGLGSDKQPRPRARVSQSCEDRSGGY